MDEAIGDQASRYQTETDQPEILQSDDIRTTPAKPFSGHVNFLLLSFNKSATLELLGPDLKKCENDKFRRPALQIPYIKISDRNGPVGKSTQRHPDNSRKTRFRAMPISYYFPLRNLRLWGLRDPIWKKSENDKLRGPALQMLDAKVSHRNGQSEIIHSDIRITPEKYVFGPCQFPITFL